MTAKDMVFATRARRRIGDGLDALANVVKVTLGPRGRNVLLDKVVRVALQNAASVAGLILTTETLIAERGQQSSS